MPSFMKQAAWALLPCLALAVSAQAAEPRYTYAEIGYVNIDFDDINEDGDGYGIGGSLAVHRNVHLLAQYQDVDLGGDRDASAASFGAGINYALRPGLDVVARLSYISAELDSRRRGDRDENGYGFEAGLRTMINPQLELNGGMRYVDVFDDNTSVFIGALYDVVPNLALGGDLEFSNDITGVFLKARYYFRGL